MKKFNLILCSLMILVIGLTSVACTNTPSSSSSSSGSGSTSTSEKPQVKSEVTMLGASTEDDFEDYYAVQTQTLLSSTEASKASTPTIATYAPKKPDVSKDYSFVSKPMPSDDPSQEPNGDPTYGMIECYYTILLDNPKDHYIMDFKIDCSVKGALFNYVSGENKVIDNSRFRWDEAYRRSGNTLATLRLFLPANTDKMNIKIYDLYYSDHDDGSNKTLADTTEHGTFKLYVVDGYIQMEDVYEENKDYNKIFKFKTGKDVTVISVKINGETVKLEGEIYFYNIANRDEEGYEGCNMEIEYTYDIDIPEWKDVKETFKRTEQIW